MAGETTFEDLHQLLSSLPGESFLVCKTSLSAEELAEVERDFGPLVAPVRRLLATWGVFTVEPREHVWRRIDLESIAPDQVVPSWLLENRVTVLPGCGGKERLSVFNEPELLEKLRKKRAVPLLHVAGTQHLIACGRLALSGSAGRKVRTSRSACGNTSSRHSTRWPRPSRRFAIRQRR